ncbi:probable WRKY transcription factor 62 [Panicum virgatum]|uniref:probable WRKY transcription factor 62 n=1 Tax=Panicum virgatum TaxID=38727 RepID=UPI0019D5A7AB|nr:probable WRKY transcription factor 62 [Panicum virgatum]
MDCCDRECAVEEVAQVYERIKIQQPFLLRHCSSLPPSTATQQLAQTHSEALRALNVALSVMKQQHQQSSAAPATPSIKAEPPSHGGAAPCYPEAITTSAARRGKRRRTTMEEAAAGKTSSWAGLTTVPYEDGYEWRKYGEKKINGTSFTRSYFRCTYKDDTGCLATKHVQQKDSSDPPVFQVTYNNKHTCNICTTTTAASKSSDREIINPHPPNNAAVMMNNVVKSKNHRCCPAPILLVQLDADCRRRRVAPRKRTGRAVHERVCAAHPPGQSLGLALTWLGWAACPRAPSVSLGAGQLGWI